MAELPKQWVHCSQIGSVHFHCKFLTVVVPRGGKKIFGGQALLMIMHFDGDSVLQDIQNTLPTLCNLL